MRVAIMFALMTTAAYGEPLMERDPATLPIQVKAGLVMAMVAECESLGLAPPGIAPALHQALGHTPKALRAYRRALAEEPWAPLDVEICEEWEMAATKYLESTQAPPGEPPTTEPPATESPAVHDTPPPPGSGLDEESD
jgi:hypothetical protein